MQKRLVKAAMRGDAPSRKSRLLETRSWLQRWAAKKCKCPVFTCDAKAEDWNSVAKHLYSKAKLEFFGLHRKWMNEHTIGLDGPGTIKKIEEVLRRQADAIG